MEIESPLTWPKKADKARLEKYLYFDKLYDGDHYDAFAIKGEKGFTAQYEKLRYIAANFAGLMSRVMADMVFGEKVAITFDDDKNQKFVDKLAEDNELFTQLYESALANSRRGDSLFKMRIGQRNPLLTSSPMAIIIEEVTPAIYFPALEQTGTRNVPSQEVLAWQFTRANAAGQLLDYLHKETHAPGYIFHEIYRYDPKGEKIIRQEKSEDFGFPAMQETGVDRPLLFYIPNVRDGNGFWGTSDYKDLSSLFFALNNRITKIDNILDQHSDPILAVPPGVLDENGEVRKESLGMFEIENENGDKPEYIVWNANLEAAFNEIETITKMLYLFSEIAPASLGADDSKGGQAESGRALKFKLLATIRKRNRKIRYYDQAIKDMLETALELAKANSIKIDDLAPGQKIERPKIQWPDGVINDIVEEVEMATERIDNGTISRADAISRLDDISPTEAAKKVKEIDDEAGPALPLVGAGSDEHEHDEDDPGAPGAPQPPAKTPPPKGK